MTKFFQKNLQGTAILRIVIVFTLLTGIRSAKASLAISTDKLVYEGELSQEIEIQILGSCSADLYALDFDISIATDAVSLVADSFEMTARMNHDAMIYFTSSSDANGLNLHFSSDTMYMAPVLTKGSGEMFRFRLNGDAITDGDASLIFANISAALEGGASEDSITSAGSTVRVNGPEPLVFDPPGGTYRAAQTITLSSMNSAEIYYTTDGSEPTKSSTSYTGAFDIDGAHGETVTVRAKAYGSGDGFVQGSSDYSFDKLPPTIDSAQLSLTNQSLTISFSEAVFSSPTGGAVTGADIGLEFQQNGGNAAVISIAELTTVGGGPLAGGETTIIVHLSLIGTPSGDEMVAVAPVDGAALYDAAGNAMNGGQTSGSLTLHDQLAPTVENVRVVDGDGAYKAGITLTVAIEFGEVVAVDTGNGTPQLMLEMGDSVRAAVYKSGSGTEILLFTYTIQEGDDIAELRYLNSGALTFNGGIIADSAGNTADLSLVDPGTAGSLSSNSSIEIDTIPPVVSAGTDVTVNSSFMLEGIAIDAEGSGLDAVEWTQLSGIGSATFSDSSIPTPTCSMSAEGVYSLLLTAVDRAGNSASDDVQVNWDTESPSVTFNWLNPYQIRLKFSEPVEGISFQNISFIPPLNIQSDAVSGNDWDLTTALQVPGTTYSIQLQNISDAAGNAVEGPLDFTVPDFISLRATAGDVVVDLEFGELDLATNGFDNGVDKLRNTSSPNIYILGEGYPASQELVSDFRAVSNWTRWRIVCSLSADIDVLLNWNTSGIGATEDIFMQLTHNEYGVGEVINMKEIDSHTYTSPFVVDVFCAPSQQMQLHIEPGWNLVGIPLLTNQNPLLDAFKQEIALGQIYQWIGDVYTAKSSASMNAEVGYWVLSELGGDSQVLQGPLADGRVCAQPGWNLISPVSTCAVPQREDIPVFWQWDPAVRQYVKAVNELQPGLGYWFFLKSADEILLELKESQ